MAEDAEAQQRQRRRCQELAEQVAELAQESGRTVATAESLTSGMVAQYLGAAPGASSWFRGAVVSYHDEVKFEVLGVEPGPVVTAKCAREMADGVARLLGAELTVSTTGAGGPDSQDDQPPGTVFVGAHAHRGTEVDEHSFDGDPEDVVEQATRTALERLVTGLR